LISGIRTAVILAGGQGTRIRALHPEIPKALIPILGRQMLTWKIIQLRDQGISEIFILTHHLGSQIQRFVKEFDADGVRIMVRDDGDVPLGTGGAILSALAELPEVFVLTYGDNLLEENLSSFENFYVKCGASNAMMTTSALNAGDKPNASVEGGFVKHYQKSQTDSLEMRHMEYGYSIWSKSYLESLGLSGTVDLTELFQRASQDGELAAFNTHLGYHEIGTPAGLAESEKWLRQSALYKSATDNR
jgi:MurNAc alpha-1-phosphate uridylyltransferase